MCLWVLGKARFSVFRPQSSVDILETKPSSSFWTSTLNHVLVIVEIEFEENPEA